MQKLEVFGANKLKGQIKISGSKNASLPILAKPALAHTTLFCASVPWPPIIVLKILEASATVFPPKIACWVLFFNPKSSAEKITSDLLETILVGKYGFHTVLLLETQLMSEGPMF